MEYDIDDELVIKLIVNGFNFDKSDIIKSLNKDNITITQIFIDNINNMIDKIPVNTRNIIYKKGMNVSWKEGSIIKRGVVKKDTDHNSKEIWISSGQNNYYLPLICIN